MPLPRAWGLRVRMRLEEEDEAIFQGGEAGDGGEEVKEVGEAEAGAAGAAAAEAGAAAEKKRKGPGDAVARTAVRTACEPGRGGRPGERYRGWKRVHLRNRCRSPARRLRLALAAGQPRAWVAPLDAPSLAANLAPGRGWCRTSRVPRAGRATSGGLLPGPGRRTGYLGLVLPSAAPPPRLPPFLLVLDGASPLPLPGLGTGVMGKARPRLPRRAGAGGAREAAASPVVGDGIAQRRGLQALVLRLFRLIFPPPLSRRLPFALHPPARLFSSSPLSSPSARRPIGLQDGGGRHRGPGVEPSSLLSLAFTLSSSHLSLSLRLSETLCLSLGTIPPPSLLASVLSSSHRCPTSPLRLTSLPPSPTSSPRLAPHLHLTITLPPPVSSPPSPHTTASLHHIVVSIHLLFRLGPSSRPPFCGRANAKPSTMAVGALLEPLVVVTLLFGGAWALRNRDFDLCQSRSASASALGPVRSSKRSDDTPSPHRNSDDSLLSDSWSGSSTPTLSLASPKEVPTLRRRKFNICIYRTVIWTPNTLVFEHRFLSRLLCKFPFLVEAWYWALVYWVSANPSIRLFFFGISALPLPLPLPLSSIYLP